MSDQQQAKDYFVYILECNDGSYYTGMTTDVDRRVAEHNEGRGARYTRSRRPVSLRYLEPAAGRAEAARRELAIKRMPRSRKEALLDGGKGGAS